MHLNFCELKKLAVITTHPIQYNAPFFQLLTERKKVISKIFYTWGETVLQSKYDPDFNKTITWDIPLLEGYEYEFIENTAKDEGSHHYNGIINPDLISKIKEWEPDAILVYGWNFQSHLKVMRYFKNRIPVWFRGDSTLLDKQKTLKSGLKKIFLKWVYSHIDMAFYTGMHNKEYFLNYGLKEHQLKKAPHAVDNSRFQNKDNRYSEAASNWRKELLIDADSIIFLFAGKLESKKGVEVLLKAFEKFTNQNVWLIIAGNGKEETYLKTSFEDLSNVTFLDFQNQQAMPVLYQLCDVFVLPSNGPNETWGLSINEAMASGRPVIASNECGGAIDLIDEGQTGYIFKAGDVEELSGKIKNLIDNKDEIIKLGDNGFKKIQEFSFEKFAESLEDALLAK
jgi:glycosyltransferase involved in cell wall biosynthesis